MTSSTVLLVIGLLASATAAPWPADLPKCARECAIAGSPKLAYAPEKTYTYSYSGKSEIHMKDVEGGVSQMEWTSQVDMSWLTPCEMAITFKNPSFGGASGTPEATFLTRYPLVVAMTDGRVQHVCSHPDDDIWSINLKKGVTSAFQNSLPSNSSVNSGLSFTETDVAGKCPTLYEVENQGEKVIVEKKKNHRFCQERFPSQAETPMSWIKAPLPMQESQSKCKQEISKGIYTSITCVDTNIIKPAFGSYKYVEAKQVSKLEFQSEAANDPQSLSNIRGHMVHRSLRYDHEVLKKNPAKVPELEEVLKQVCEKTKHGVEKETASLVNMAIHLMRHVPEEAIEQLLQKIKGGQICNEQEKMENLFLDVVAFTQEASAVKVMVMEILSDRTSRDRGALYTAALYFTARPSLRAVEAVKPLFEQSERFPMASLAAATMVNTYCKHNPHCEEEAPVRQAAEVLGSKIQQHCSSSAGEEAEKHCIACLKSLGNMGVMTSQIARNIISFIEKQDAAKHLRIAAAQSFRNARCDREPTKQLVRNSVDPEKDTEIRIASYLAAIKCAEEEDIRKISDKLSSEDNTQVRGFILSHLLNLQESSAPHKKRLQYILSSISIPSNFTADVRKYSRNIDYLYDVYSIGTGVGAESDIIYAPRSFVPRSVKLNLTSMWGYTPVNLGEFGARIEGLEPVVESLFGPEGYFQKSSFSKIIKDISEHSVENGVNILEHINERVRERRSIDMSTISHFFSQIYGGHNFPEPRADLFARFSGQEVAYASITKTLLQNINVDRMVDSVSDVIDDVLRQISNMKDNSARALQLSLDYSLPTIQGLPLKMKLDGTAVVGWNIDSRLNNLESSSPSVLKVIPSVSADVKGFIGFDSFIASCGVRTKNMISSNNGVSINVKGGRGFELELDIPEKMEVLNVKSETYLMKALQGHSETKISPEGVRHSRVQSQNCFRTLEDKTGIKVCYAVDVPDVFRSEGLPLGPAATAKLTVEKSESSIRGYRVKADLQNSPSRKEIKLAVDTPGSSSPRRAEGHLSFSQESDAYKVETAMSSQASGGVKMELRSKISESERELAFDAYSSHNQEFSPESQILEAKFSSQFIGPHSRVLVLTQTKNALKNYMDHYFELRSDWQYSPRTGLFYPRSLEKMDIRNLIGNYKVVSTVQKRSETEYDTVIKAGSRTADKVAIEATHRLEGTWEEGMTVKTTGTARIGDEQYKTAFYVHNTHEKMGTSLKVVRPHDSSKVIECEALVETSDQSLKHKIQLDVPGYINAVKFNSNVIKQGNHQYEVRAALEYGSQVLIQLDGPVTAKFSEGIKHFETDMRVRTLPEKLHKISSAFIWSDNNQVLSFDVKDQEETTISLEWKLSVENQDESKAVFNFLLPKVMDNKFNAVIGRKYVQLNFSNVISPGSSSSRHMKGSGDINTDSNTAKAEFYWDAERDSSKKIAMEAMIIRGPPSSQEKIIQGKYNIKGSTYRYKAALKHSDPEAWLYGQKDFKFEIVTPSQRTHNIESTLNIERRESHFETKGLLKYKNPESKLYEFNAVTNFGRDRNTWNFKYNTKADIILAESTPVILILEARHEKNPTQREAYVQVQIESPSWRKPLKTSFALMHQPHTYKGEWKTDIETPTDAAQYKLRLSPEGGVQEFKVGLYIKEVVSFVKAAKRIAGIEPGSRSESEEASYIVHYQRPHYAHHKISVDIPSRKMEGEVRHSPSEYSVKFYPKRDRGDSRYELSFTHPDCINPLDCQVRYEGRLHHPSLERMKRIEVLYTNNEEKTEGTVTLDIFPREEYKIVGTIESTKIAKDNIKIEARLSGKALKMNPMVTATASYAPHTAGIDFLYKMAPTSNPSLLISGKYDRPSGRNAALSLIVKTESGPVFEVSGAVEPKQRTDCNGMKISAVVHSAVIGSFSTVSDLCSPAYVEFGINRHGSDKRYIHRIGLQALKNLELSTSEIDVTTQEERPISLVQVKLLTPVLVSAEVKYDAQKERRLWTSAQEDLSRLFSSSKSWMNNNAQELLREESSASSSEIDRLWHNTKEEAKKIYEDIVPSFEAVHHISKSQFAHTLIEDYRSLLSKVKSFQQELYSSMRNSLGSVRHLMEAVARVIDGAGQEGAHWLRTGEIPETTRRVVEQIRDLPVWEKTRRVLDRLFERFPEEYHTIKGIVDKMKAALAKDVENARINLLSNRAKLWMWTHLRLGEPVLVKLEEMFDKTVQTSFIDFVEVKPNHLGVQIPLREPVHSLIEAVKYVSFNPAPIPELVQVLYQKVINRLASLPINQDYHVLPPFNGTAMIVDGTEILTFDGSVLRAPKSPCEVTLVTYETHALTMKNPESNPEFTLKTAGATVEMKSDHKVYVNGREVRGQQATEGEVKIWKSPEEIKIESPHMTITVHPRNNVMAVEVSRWVFGRTAGLLGTYDGEIANDWATFQGTRASSLQELVKSWQKNQHCQTPTVLPVRDDETPLLKSIQCHALLAVRSQCSDVVRPEPFVKICQASRNPCNVAKAYRAICSSKNVRDIFPLSC